MRLSILIAVAALGMGILATSSVHADYLLRDGDTVVFLGDSITAARTYGKIIERYTLLRFPKRKIHFVNSGWGGDTASGGLKRLDRDVFAHNPSVLIFAYGINDIGWGTKADDPHKKAYLDAIRGIIERCKEREIRVFVCSAAATAADPEKSEGDYLQRMCDEGMALARSLGEKSIDVQRAMREIQKTIKASNAQRKASEPKDTLHTGDGVHLNDLGQLAMAFAILKGLDAPANVSSVEIDAKSPRVLKSEGCRVMNVSLRDKRLEFDRLDEGLPLNFGVFGALQFRYIPVPDELNRYLLAITDLPAGRYRVEAEGRGVGVYTDEQLAHGVNIASATANAWEPGGPWDAQAALLAQITDARSELAQARLLTGRYLPGEPNVNEADGQSLVIDAKVEALQRTIAAPYPYHFVVRPVAERSTSHSSP